MSKYIIQPQFECQNKILHVRIRYLGSVRMSKKGVNDKNAILMTNRIFNVKIRYSASVRMSK